MHFRADDETDIFDAQDEFIQARKQIRAQGKTRFDRLSSIVTDIVYVEHVIKAYELPAICNERCGRWYVPQDKIAAAVYFKSTDGHTDHCKFSLRRLNMHVLPIVGSHKGVIIVDSTRRGKRMPDALSKTIPIWCCVINRAASILLKKDWSPEALTLYTPPKVVSQNEQNTIERQLDGFVRDLLATGIDSCLFKDLDKPLRPMWLTPDSTIQHVEDRFVTADFYPIVLVTASKRVPDGIERQEGYTYIQGAADDEEMWAGGLTPLLFWRYREELLKDSSNECIRRCVEHNQNEIRTDRASTRVQIGQTGIYLASEISSNDLVDFLIIDLSSVPTLTDMADNPLYHHTPMVGGKKGASHLRETFSRVESVVSTHYAASCIDNRSTSILLTDEEDCKAKACLIALQILVQFHDSVGAVLPSRCKIIDKELIRQRLVPVVNARAGLNPPRASLKSLNEYLMSGAFRRS